MSTAIDGVVTYSRVESVPNPHTGALARNAVRVHMRQRSRGAPQVEAVVDTGAGSDGLLRAQAMCMRLRPGTEVSAIGEAIVVRQEPDGPHLLVRKCSRVLGGEARHHHEADTHTTQEAA